MTGGGGGAGPSPAISPPAADGTGPRGVVVLQMRLTSRLPVAPAEDLARIAGVARGLAPGELLAVRSHAPLEPGDVDPGPEAGGHSALACAFAPDDHELFLWRAPPAPPSVAGPAVGGELTLDVRPLSPRIALVAAVAAVAGLRPGERLIHVGDGPPLLLVDLLAGRASLGEVRYTGGEVLGTLVRL